MEEKYFIWIMDNYPTSKSAELQCKEATEKMAEAFPELKRVRGMAHVKEPYGLLPTKTFHWWLVTQKGDIVDPVAHQYPLGIVKYVPADESRGKLSGRCMNCGDLCYNNSSVCSEKCGKILNDKYSDYGNQLCQ